MDVHPTNLSRKFQVPTFLQVQPPHVRCNLVLDTSVACRLAALHIAFDISTMATTGSPGSGGWQKSGNQRYLKEKHEVVNYVNKRAQ